MFTNCTQWLLDYFATSSLPTTKVCLQRDLAAGHTHYVRETDHVDGVLPISQSPGLEHGFTVFQHTPKAGMFIATNPWDWVLANLAASKDA